MNSGYFQTVGFVDTYNFKVDGKPKGYYWELIVKVDDLEWKIDMWYMKLQDQYPVIEPTIEFEKLLKDNPNKKLTILKLKQKTTENGKYKAGLNGYKIYNAVLKNNVSNFEELKDYYKINTSE